MRTPGLQTLTFPNQSADGARFLLPLKEPSSVMMDVSKRSRLWFRKSLCLWEYLAKIYTLSVEAGKKKSTGRWEMVGGTEWKVKYRLVRLEPTEQREEWGDDKERIKRNESSGLNVGLLFLWKLDLWLSSSKPFGQTSSPPKCPERFCRQPGLQPRAKRTGGNLILENCVWFFTPFPQLEQ